jgi:hypothetical protein
VASHYRQNLFLYVHNDFIKTIPGLSAQREVLNANSMMVVDAYIVFGLAATLKRLPAVFWSSLGRRILRLWHKNDSSHLPPRDIVNSAPQGGA